MDGPPPTPEEHEEMLAAQAFETRQLQLLRQQEQQQGRGLADGQTSFVRGRRCGGGHSLAGQRSFGWTGTQKQSLRHS